MLFRAIPCNSVLFRAIPCNSVLFRAIPWRRNFEGLLALDDDIKGKLSNTGVSEVGGWQRVGAQKGGVENALSNQKNP